MPNGQSSVGHKSFSARLLRLYLARRDVRCPLCGYNLRNLTSARCPECGEIIELRVGLAKPLGPIPSAEDTPLHFVQTEAP